MNMQVRCTKHGIRQVNSYGESNRVAHEETCFSSTFFFSLDRLYHRRTVGDDHGRCDGKIRCYETDIAAAASVAPDADIATDVTRRMQRDKDPTEQLVGDKDVAFSFHEAGTAIPASVSCAQGSLNANSD